MTKQCSVEGCENVPRGKSYCIKHYLRWKRHGNPLAGRTPNGEMMVYIENCLKIATLTECQIWPYKRDKNGYGRLAEKLVHRIVCEKIYGPPPSPEMSNVAHSCGNGAGGCFNYLHLRWATYSQNENDKLFHGTHNRGEQSGRHKLTEAEVKFIRFLYDNKMMNMTQISHLFPVSWAQVRRVVLRIDWNWLE